MKKVIVVATVLILALNLSHAQDYKPFQLYMGLGAAIPEGGGGILFNVEPTYRVSDQIAVGLRIESVLMASEVDGNTNDLYAVGSYSVNGKFYLSNERFRLYIGAGFGLYVTGALTLAEEDGIASSTQIGFYPRIGFDLGHFNVNIDYNIVSKTGYLALNDDLSFTPREVKNNYMGIRVGAFVFGGRK